MIQKEKKYRGYANQIKTKEQSYNCSMKCDRKNEYVQCGANTVWCKFFYLQNKQSPAMKSNKCYKTRNINGKEMITKHLRVIGWKMEPNLKS